MPTVSNQLDEQYPQSGVNDVDHEESLVAPAANEYTYTDHSRVIKKGNAASVTSSHRSSSSQESVPNNIRVQVLPVKLAAILDEPRFQDIICWMPHGRAWKVLRPKEFTERVASNYFQYPNYNSFIRLVNAWGFRRIKTGVDANAYFHEVRLPKIARIFVLHVAIRRERVLTTFSCLCDSFS